ncbi:HD domain-containing protein [Deinococcus sp. Arct2-2]|uniref:HD domain-containing phosphohydrolase n=1 Tax=Deinococcus sp. Arct2-2 TaxID=2568653 RepID=UPI0010A55F40|nr:HD domain-containing phosphohydrolase [Deinococcus sp. Arct2-2]THF71086.1 HD domain-containing protein [Deinococcus sp. Arct2-2]
MTGALPLPDNSPGDPLTPLLIPAEPLPQQPLSLGDLTLHLTQLGLTAPDLGSAMSPVLNVLVERTTAVGAGYFQLRDATLTYHARAASGVMPQGPAMDALLAHGLPHHLPLVQALETATGPLFFDDTRLQSESAGFPDLGVFALTAAPIRNRAGVLVGALLSHVFEPHLWTPYERQTLGTIMGLVALLAARLDAEEREQAAHESALRALGLMLEARDAETQGHTDRVTALAGRLGQRLGLSAPELRDLRWGAYLHDIGKMAIPDVILHHPGALDAESRARMQLHVKQGAELAGQLSFLPRSAHDVILAHHECWDGSGYPLGLSGENIPLSARIFAACDVYDALTSARPYKHAWSHAEAAAHMFKARGGHFDAVVVDALLAVLDEDQAGLGAVG